MTLPTAVVTRQVTYKLVFTALDPSDPSGDPVEVVPAAGSSATFTAGPTQLTLTGADTLAMLPQPRTVAIGSDGTITATLECTDTDVINPQDWAWTVSFALSGGMVAAPFRFQLPAGDGALDLATVTPVSDAGGVLTTRGPRTDISGGTATSLAYGSDPTVTVTEGDDGSEVVSFGVPVGAPGAGVPDTDDASDGDWIYYDGTAHTTKWGAPTVASAEISDATTVGKEVLTAADAATARTAIGAGTGSSDFSGSYDDLTDAPTLGTAAAKNTGTTTGTIPVLNASGQLDMARMASGTPNGSQFVRDDGTLATPSTTVSLTSQAATIPSNVTLTTNTWVTWQTITLGVGTWLITALGLIGPNNSNCNTRASAGTGTPTLAGVTQSQPSPIAAGDQIISLSFIATVTAANSTVLLQSNATATSNSASAFAGSGYTAVKIA